MKKFKIFGPDERYDGYSQYLLVDYRQKLLRVVLIICLAITAGLTAINLFDWIKDPLSQWSSYNVISDVMGLAILFFLGWANQKGFVAVSGWLFGLIVLAYIPISYSLARFNEAFLIMALPVVVSSFIIQPRASFLFAGIIVVSYNLTFFYYRGAFDYESSDLYQGFDTRAMR